MDTPPVVASVEPPPPAWGGRDVIIVLGISFAACFALALRKYSAMNSTGDDMALIVNNVWYTLHGKLFYSVFHGRSHFAMHAGYLGLLFVPFYALVPSVPTLLFVQSALIVSSGWPFYLIARHVLQEHRCALLLTIAYLFYPTVVTNHVDQLHFEPLALPFLMGAAYFFFTERLRLFLIFGFLAMLGQENIPFTIGFFSAYAALKRRKPRWILWPIVMASTYALFVFKVAMPYFAGTQQYRAFIYLNDLGRTPAEVFQTCLYEPWRLVTRMLDYDRITYVIKILQPLFWAMPLLAWETILVLPSLGMNLLVTEPGFRVIAWHYGSLQGAFLCIGSVFGVRRLANYLQHRFNLNEPKFALSLCLAALSVASWPLWLNESEYQDLPYRSTMDLILDAIPPNSSVLAPIELLPHVAERKVYVDLLQFDPKQRWNDTWPREKMFTLDYIILDGNEWRYPADRVTQELVMSIYKNPNYELIVNENNMFLFRRRTLVSVVE